MLLAGDDDVAAGAVSFRYRSGEQKNGVPVDEEIAGDRDRGGRPHPGLKGPRADWPRGRRPPGPVGVLGCIHVQLSTG